MSASVVNLSFVDDIAVLVVDNPPVNTIDAGVRRDLSAALDALQGRPGLKAVAAHLCRQHVLLRRRHRRVRRPAEGRGVPRHCSAASSSCRVPVVVAHARHGDGRRPRDLRSPATTASRCAEHALRPAGGDARHHPGRRRHAAHAAADRRREDARAGDLGAGRSTPAPACSSASSTRIVEGDIRAGDAGLRARTASRRATGPRRTCDRAVDPATATPRDPRRGALPRRASSIRTAQAALTAIEAVGASRALPFEAGLRVRDRAGQRRQGDRRVARRWCTCSSPSARRARCPACRPTRRPRPVASGRRHRRRHDGRRHRDLLRQRRHAGHRDRHRAGGAEARPRRRRARRYESMVKRGRLTAEDKAKRLALIRGSLDYADLRRRRRDHRGGVREHGAEEEDLRRRSTQVAKPGAVLATNTSTLDIDGHRAARRGARRTSSALHFFSPANVMPLLEVVRTDDDLGRRRSAPRWIWRSRCARRRCWPRVCYGFIGNRMMEGYAREAERMVLEGATPRQVDYGARELGHGDGHPRRVRHGGRRRRRATCTTTNADAVSARSDLLPGRSSRCSPPAASGRRTARATTATCPATARATTIRRRSTILRADGEAPRRCRSARTATQEIVERCLYPLLNEGIRILEEGIALRASDIDVVWTAATASRAIAAARCSTPTPSA